MGNASAGSEYSNEENHRGLAPQVSSPTQPREIARACGLSKGVVGKYVSATHTLGITWPLPDGVDEARLEALLFTARQPSGCLVEPDYFQMHQALKRKGVSLQLLWAEYVVVQGERAYRYVQYCHRCR
jgi:transposase